MDGEFNPMKSVDAAYPVRPKPFRDAASAVEEVAQAILDSRLHLVSTLKQDPLSWDIQIVIDPKP